MCQYEKTCTEKPLPTIVRRNWRFKDLNIEKYSCEREEKSCYVYVTKRWYLRSDVSKTRGQLILVT